MRVRDLLRAGVVASGALALLGGAEAQTLSVSAAECAQLVRHVPAPDVAYRPGVDVSGRPVAPADLESSTRLELTGPIVIDVAVDLYRYGLPATSPLFQPHASIGALTIAPDGRATLGGRPLQATETGALAEICRQRLKTPR